MKNLVFASAGLLMGFGAFGEASVDRVLVRQQWPWSSQVRVDYEVSGAPAEGVNLDVEIKAAGLTLDTAAVNRATVAGGIIGVKNGFGSFAIDPVLAFGTDLATREITVKVTVADTPVPEQLDRVEYRVVDLETGKMQDLTRRDFYNCPGLYGSFTTDYSTVGPGFASSLAAGETFVWTGVNSDLYKTTKLALKRIPAKDVVWTMGPSEDDTKARAAGDWYYPEMGESRVQVKLSKDYFMGVFELTQRQYELLTGERPSYFTNATAWATYPVEQVPLSWQDFVAKINGTKNLGLKVPTEAQWEFATRAGYYGANLPNGKEDNIVKDGDIETHPNYAELEGYDRTRGHTDRNATTAIYKVGVGRPNAYGLFNTLGNITEWVAEEPRTNLENYYASRSKPVEDPVATSADGMFGASYGALRGGNFNLGWWRYALRIATPDGQTMQYTQPLWGWRVCMDAE